MKTVKRIKTKFGYLKQEEIPAGVSLRTPDNFALAVVVKDKKALNMHIAEGGSREKWNPVFATLMVTEMKSCGKPSWDFIETIDISDILLTSTLEETGNLIRGFSDIETAVSFAVEKLEQLLCPKEIA